MTNLWREQLKPFVSKDVPPVLNPGNWPHALSKSEEARYSLRNGIYSPKGFDGHYYLQLANHSRTLAETANSEAKKQKDSVVGKAIDLVTKAYNRI